LDGGKNMKKVIIACIMIMMLIVPLAGAFDLSSIKNTGGITVLAHPGAGIYLSDYNKVVPAALDLGVEGIECYHPENRLEVTEYCLEICKKNNLYITGGSDCHGDFVKERRLGKPDVYLDQLALWEF